MCIICGSEGKTRNIDLYVIGSEGLNACHSCEMKVVEFVRMLMNVGSEAKRNVYLRFKKERA